MNATQATPISNWKICPVSGGGICLVGTVATRGEIQTSNITQTHSAGFVRTESGAVYKLGDRNPGLWDMQLQMRRPEKYATLVKNGIL